MWLRRALHGAALLLALLTSGSGAPIAGSGLAEADRHARAAHSGGVNMSSPAPSTGPVIHLDVAQGTGTIARLVGGSVVQETVTVALRESIPSQSAPGDTVPANARIDFHWFGQPGPSGAPIVSYDYGAGPVDTSVHSASFGPLTPGTKVFSLRATDSAGATTQILRRFRVNYDPDTWISGPDTSAIAIVPGSGGQRYLSVSNWEYLPPIPGSLMSCDSLTQWPAARIPRKTFLEIYDGRIYLRAENDTVNMNSWVVVHSGGSDLDSPYSVFVAPGDTALEDTVTCAAAGPPAVVRPSGLTGSPIGFRNQYAVALTGSIGIPAPSALYPFFIPSSSFYRPAIAGYLPMLQSGKVYLVTRAVDGHGAQDATLADMYNAMLFANDVDTGVDADPAHVALRQRLILTFHVNRAPYLRFDDPTLFPRPPEQNGGVVSGYTDRRIRLHLPASDPDPFDREQREWPTGGPTPTSVFRYTVTVTGRNASGRDTSYQARPFFVPDRLIDLDAVAPYLVGRDLRLSIELCDCVECEATPGSGRCVTYEIPVRVDISTATLPSLIDAQASAGIVRVRWQVGRGGTWGVDRRTPETGWLAVAEIVADGGGEAIYEDRAVVPGARYGYRLVDPASGRALSEAWVSVPTGAEFSLEGVSPNPAARGAFVSFTVPDAGPTLLEVFDVVGRRIRFERLSLEAGRHLVGLGSGLSTGIHLVRVSHGGRVLTKSVVVLN